MKRSFDIAASLAGLVLLSPLLVLVALAIFCIDGRPVLFRQARPGLHGRIFSIVKFRTMRDAPAGSAIAGTARVTPLGQILRTTSLDELPELWNVLTGDMSLVGPRPLLISYLPLYSASQARRHEVRPGLTGMAQVNGRNSLSWERKFELDVWYVENQSLRLDLKILIATLGQIFRRSQVDASAADTMTLFTGTSASR